MVDPADMKNLMQELKEALEAEERSEERNMKLEQEVDELHKKLVESERQLEARPAVDVEDIQELKERISKLQDTNRVLDRAKNDAVRQLELSRENVESATAAREMTLKQNDELRKQMEDDKRKWDAEIHQLQRHLTDAKNLAEQRETALQEQNKRADQESASLIELRAQLEKESASFIDLREQLDIVVNEKLKAQEDGLKAKEEAKEYAKKCGLLMKKVEQTNKKLQTAKQIVGRFKNAVAKQREILKVANETQQKLVAAEAKLKEERKQREALQAAQDSNVEDAIAAAQAKSEKFILALRTELSKNHEAAVSATQAQSEKFILALRAELSKKEEELKEAQLNYEQDVANIKARNEEDIQTLTEDIRALTGKINQLQSENEDLQKTSADLKLELTNKLTTKPTEQNDEKVQQLNSKLLQLQQEKEELKNASNDLEKELTIKSTQLTENLQQIQREKEELFETSESFKKEQANKSKKLAENLQEVQKENERLQKVSADLKKELLIKLTQENELKELNGKILELQSENEQLRKTMEKNPAPEKLQQTSGGNEGDSAGWGDAGLGDLLGGEEPSDQAAQAEPARINNTEEVERLNCEVKEREEEVEALRRRLDVASKNSKKLKSKVRELQKEVGAQRRAAKAAAKAAEAKAAEVKAAEEEARAAKAQAETMAPSLQEGAFEELKNLRSALQAARKAEVEAKDKFDKCWKAQETLLADGEALEAENESLKTELKDVKQALEMLKESSTSTDKTPEVSPQEAPPMNKRTSSMMSIMEGGGTRAHETPEPKIAQLTREVTRLRNELNATKLKLSQSERKAKASPRVKELESEIQMLKEKEQAVQAQLEEVKGALEASNKETETLREQNGLLEEEKHANTTKMADLEENARKAREEATEAKAAAETAKAGAKEAKSPGETPKKTVTNSISAARVKKIGEKAISLLRSWESYAKKVAENERERRAKEREEKKKRDEEQEKRDKEEAERNRGMVSRLFGRKVAVVKMRNNEIQWDEATQTYIIEGADDDDNDKPDPNAVPHPPRMANSIQKQLDEAASQANIDGASDGTHIASAGLPPPKRPGNPFARRGVSGRFGMPTVAGFGGPSASSSGSAAARIRLRPAMPGMPDNSQKTPSKQPAGAKDSSPSTEGGSEADNEELARVREKFEEEKRAFEKEIETLRAAIKRMGKAEQRLKSMQRSSLDREREQAARELTIKKGAHPADNGLVSVNLSLSRFSAAAMGAMFVGMYAAASQAE
mmetsp:Transcript_2365/g.3394  ORF Transcript_2365/g.3394 Transcript_2365/m.3394 type:complete len:1248 (-) Transcript_2365:47-3790(-)